MNQRRRSLLLGLASAAALARAQPSDLPAIGFLNGIAPGPWAHAVAGFRAGLSEEGFVEGRNVAVEYRWAENHEERVPGLAQELVRRQVQVLVACGGDHVIFAAKAATSTIPIVFSAAGDPVARGLVASLNRPGGNLTGVTWLLVLLNAKRLQLLHELVPAVTDVAHLVYPFSGLQANLKPVEDEAHRLGLRLIVESATADVEIEAAFTTFVQRRAGALLCAANPFFDVRRERIAALSARHRLPAIYGIRQYVDAGGLMSYGADLADVYRHLGVYASRILKGAKPADLPVLQPTKFDLVINRNAAKNLGIAVPQSLLLRVDEVIE